MHLIVGRVDTKIWGHLAETLPQDSIYSPIADKYESVHIGRMNSESHTKYILHYLIFDYFILTHSTESRCLTALLPCL